MESSESDSRIGQMIGNYVLSSVLGEGGMGSVYVGEHPEIKRRVAIKVLHPSLTQQPDFAERFIDEARIIAQLDHPNVVDIYDFGRSEDGALYYVMEILEGIDLGEVLAETMRLSPIEVMPYLVQICAALDAAHEVGVVHRDLKLENIYVLDRDPLHVKLLDFGISKMLDTQKRAHSKTGTGVVIGTPTFMAPEQAAGRQEQIGPQTDLYALGVVLFYLLAGRPPFTAETAPELMVKHMKEPPPSIRSIDPDLPEELDALLNLCLAKDPRQRPPSATWIVEAYAAALDLEQVVGAGSSPVPARVVRRSTTGRRRAPASPASTSTLSGSAAEMSALTLPRSSIWGRVALVVSALAVGVAVVLVLRWTAGRDRPAEPRSAAKQTVTTPQKHADKQAANDQRVGVVPPKPVVKPVTVQTVTVSSDEPEIRCRYAVGDGDTLTTNTPCRIEVPWGEELSLEVRRHGHSSWVKRWQVKGNQEMHATTHAKEKRITVVDLGDAAKSAAAQEAVTQPDAGPAPPPERPRTSAWRARRSLRRARRRRGRRARARKRPATEAKKSTEPTRAGPGPAVKKASTKKGSKRVGAGTLDF